MPKKKVTQVEFVPALTANVDAAPQKRKVAAYARVSTSSEEQETSLFAQREYYEDLIRNNVTWEFAGIYYDDGLSGLSYRNRDGFNRMISDALDEKIDLIITKSISRFARNTVDTLVTIRKLKDAGIEVYFEKEHIHTLDAAGEFLITLMSSLAQEESRSISENVTWGQRKRFSDGKYSAPYSRFLGYDRGKDGYPAVNKKEAQIVKLIYRLWLLGESDGAICGYLERHQIPAPGGREQWSGTTVMSILTNEKYKGDALLQKSFTVDFLNKRKKKTRAKSRSIMLKMGTRPSYLLLCSIWCRKKSGVALRCAGDTAVHLRSQQGSFAVCAERFTVQRPHIPTASMSMRFGGAPISMTAGNTLRP